MQQFIALVYQTIQTSNCLIFSNSSYVDRSQLATQPLLQFRFVSQNA